MREGGDLAQITVRTSVAFWHRAAWQTRGVARRGSFGLGGTLRRTEHTGGSQSTGSTRGTGAGEFRREHHLRRHYRHCLRHSHSPQESVHLGHGSNEQRSSTRTRSPYAQTAIFIDMGFYESLVVMTMHAPGPGATSFGKLQNPLLAIFMTFQYCSQSRCRIIGNGLGSL